MVDPTLPITWLYYTPTAGKRNDAPTRREDDNRDSASGMNTKTDAGDGNQPSVENNTDAIRKFSVLILSLNAQVPGLRFWKTAAVHTFLHQEYGNNSRSFLSGGELK